jgi:hypothetical protein
VSEPVKIDQKRQNMPPKQPANRDILAQNKGKIKAKKPRTTNKIS